MTVFDLGTLNCKVFPATAPLLAASGERVRIRLGNLSMWNHPIHLHGHRYWVTGSDGGRWPRALWRPDVTEIVGVGQARDKIGRGPCRERGWTYGETSGVGVSVEKTQLIIPIFSRNCYQEQ